MLVPPGVDKEALRGLVQKTHAAGFSVLDDGSGGGKKGGRRREDPENPLWQVLDGIRLALEQRVLSTNMFRKGLASQEFVDLCKCIYQTMTTTDGPTKRRRRVLIIGDEAHFGACRNGQVDVLFHGAKHGASGNDPNWLNPLCEPNVVVVHVSATAWNLDVVPFCRVLDWTTAGAADARKGDGSSYVSWEAYARGKHQDKAICDGDFDEKVVAVRQWLLREASVGERGMLLSVVSSLVLMVDYALEFWRLAWLKSNPKLGSVVVVPPSAATALVVEKLLLQQPLKQQKGGGVGKQQNDATVLIRVQRGGIQMVFARWLKIFRSLFQLPEEVQGSSSSSSSSCYQVACPSCPSESDSSGVGSSSSSSTTLLVVVERGRMGDTWPHLIAFDLRARYGSSLLPRDGKANASAGASACFSSFLQDAGRCFGHRSNPPLLILNQRGYYLLQGRTWKLDSYLKPLRGGMVWQLQLPGLTYGVDGGRVGAGGVDNKMKERLLQPTPRSMFYRLHAEECSDVLQHYAKNRILFYAGSQQGKTGAFLALLALFLARGASVGSDFPN